MDIPPLARVAVDRAALRRGEPVVAELWADPATRVLVVRDGTLPVRSGPGGLGLDLCSPSEVAAAPPEQGPDQVVAFLGQDDDAAYLAVLHTEPADDGRTWAVLRDVGHDLGDRDVDLAGTAVALAAWHARNRRCPRCGRPNEPAQAGWTRTCPVDGAEEYPRTDPAVIMAVVDDADRILLGHAAHWPPRRFSTLAGYVEPGESAEAAVRREVAEEVGVEVGDLSYVGSQPWPFPASLMLAFRARARTTEVRVDGRELTEARWFTRDELLAVTTEGQVGLPMRSSIARMMIETWFGGSLPDGVSASPARLRP